MAPLLLFPIVQYALLSLAAATSLVLISIFYNIFLHPLRSFPGPWYAKTSLAWTLYHLVRGDHFRRLHELHQHYGPVVRIGPNELSFVDADAWKDIYGHHQGQPEFPRDPSQLLTTNKQHPDIISADREQHAKLRRLLSNAFSDKALKEQEEVLTSYMDQLVVSLRERMKKGEEVDIVKWYNFTTFDVIGHLAFTESFDCLSSSAYHPWVTTILSTAKFITLVRAVGRVSPSLVPLAKRFLFPASVVRNHAFNWNLVWEKLAHRRANPPAYTDFLTHLLAAEEKGVLVDADLKANAPLIVLAGSETTATLLSGATYYLLRDRAVHDRLAAEIRGMFASADEITLARVGECRYLLAVLNEGLRLYPPANSTHPRVVPPGGATIAGYFVPAGTLVGIGHTACFSSERNFADPERFVPERWMPGEDARYDGDHKEALQPFHVGPRACIGRNLAYIEMRLILAKILFEFDMELTSSADDWADQPVFSVWIKKPLMVRLSPARK